jgi:Flp pilus assembly protein TadG
VPKSASASRRGLGRRGIAATEFAIVAGILFLTMLAVMDLSRYFLTMHSMRTVVAQAGRALMINPALGSTALTCNAQALVASTGGLGFVTSTGRLCVTVSPALDAASQPIRGMLEADVRLNAPYRFVLPIFGVSSTELVERQRFRFAA